MDGSIAALPAGVFLIAFQAALAGGKVLKKIIKREEERRREGEREERRGREGGREKQKK